MLSAPDFAYKQIVIVLIERGEKLACKNDNLIVTDAEGQILHQSSCYRLFAVFIVGNLTITSPLLQRALKFGFSLFFMSQNLRVYGTWNTRAEGNVLLRKRQYDYDKLDIAAYLVVQKIQAQLENLKRIREKPHSLKLAITNLKDYCQRVDGQIELQELLGLEGIASRVYFKEMFLNYDWKGRKPRTKCDISNTLLDLGYTLLFNVVDSLLQLYGFDVYKGVFHQEFYQRKSLVCDLVEPFRPLIDYQLHRAWQLKQIDVNDFTFSRQCYSLSWHKNKKYLLLFIKILMEHKQGIFLFLQEYYRAFIRQKPMEQYPIWQPHK